MSLFFMNGTHSAHGTNTSLSAPHFMNTTQRTHLTDTSPLAPSPMNLTFASRLQISGTVYEIKWIPIPQSDLV